MNELQKVTQINSFLCLKGTDKTHCRHFTEQEAYKRLVDLCVGRCFMFIRTQKKQSRNAFVYPSKKVLVKLNTCGHATYGQDSKQWNK